MTRLTERWNIERPDLAVFGWPCEFKNYETSTLADLLPDVRAGLVRFIGIRNEKCRYELSEAGAAMARSEAAQPQG